MNYISNILLPRDVTFIIKELEQKGFEAFAVGGCIRDSIIGRQPHDWDIATSAKPEQVKAIFSKTIDTGIKHGTVTIMVDSNAYEITTYRIEDKYINNRKPEKVDFTDSLEADLSRRDFTINSMAYNEAKGLIDPFKGLEDIDCRQIRAVGAAELRFEEDALRMLRAIRFSAQLGYDIECNTIKAIGKNHRLVRNISGERIKEELTKILQADPMSFELLHETGLLAEIMPELDICFSINQNNPYHIYNIAMHNLQAASKIRSEAILRWTMLLHDIGKADTLSTDSHGINHFYKHSEVSAEKAERIMQRLRFDNSSAARIKKLILEHDRQVEDNEKSIRKAISAIGADLFADWLEVRLADIQAQNPLMLPERVEKLDIIKAIFHKITAEKQCLSIRDLAVNGKDLMGLGLSQGKKVGEILQKLFEEVIEQPELNQKHILLELAKLYI